MKRLSFLLIVITLLFTGQSFAKSLERLALTYNLVSDVPNASVPNGMCRIKGTVFKNGMPVNTGLVGNYGLTISNQVDSLGNYSILIPESDSIIFFYAMYHAEIITNPYDFKSGNEVVIDFYTADEIEMIQVDKPVIYMYNDYPIKAELSLNFSGEMTFTYPGYDNGWAVDVNPNGVFVDNRPYPYLFWEGEMQSLNYVESNGELKGFVIQTDSVISFLENQLTAIGLNRNEQTDFITFWGPRMTQSPYAMVQFMIDEDYAKHIADLQINPTPESIKRVYLLFTPYKNQPPLRPSPQVFKPFDRTGFTLIEWGGSEINPLKEAL